MSFFNFFVFEIWIIFALIKKIDSYYFAIKLISLILQNLDDCNTQIFLNNSLNSKKYKRERKQQQKMR